MRHHPPEAGRRWQATLIVALFFLAVAGAAAAGWWYARESPPHQGPIVLISVEGLRADRLPVYGATGRDTPSIDALAADAVVFERAYTHSPLTLPAHASLLAGQLPFEHGVRDEAGFRLKDDTRSLAELLQNRGFETGAAVSSFLLRPESGVAQGFTFFDAELPEEPGEPGPVVERDGAHTAAAAEQWVRTQRDQRFFLFVQVGDADAESTITRVVGQLKDRGLYDQATIMLTADRGSAEVLLDRASLQVPLLVKQPDAQGAGRRVASPVQHIDLLPTVLDLVRAPMPPGLRGRSLRPILDGDEEVVDPLFVYAESLAPRFRLGSQGMFALFAPSSEAPETPQLRAALERLLEGREVDVPAEIPAAHEDAYAAFGYLGGGAVADSASVVIEPDDVPGLIEAHREAALLASQKKYNAAIERLQAIAFAYPELAVVEYQLGTLLARTGRLQEAVASYRTVAALQPDNPYVAAAIVRLLTRMQQYDEAWTQAALSVALAERRDARSRAVAHEAAARVALARADTEAAETHAAAAQTADPSLPMPQFVRGRLLYDSEDYDGALVAFEESAALAAQLDRPLEDLHWYLGDTLARLDRQPDAETHFREELRAFPRSLRSFSSLAMMYGASNRDQDVADVLEELVKAAPTPEGYASAATLWTTLGERERAASLRNEARTRFRGDPALALVERDATR